MRGGIHTVKVRPATPEIKSPTAMEGLSDVRVGDFPRGNGTNAKTDREGEGDLVRVQEGEPS